MSLQGAASQSGLYPVCEIRRSSTVSRTRVAATQRVLMLPNANAGPACVVKAFIGIAIPGRVSGDLIGPELRVRCGYRVVNGTPVPEAAVEKHGDLSAAKDEVCCATEILEGTSRNSVAEAERVNGRPEGHLWRSVSAAVRLHACPNPGEDAHDSPTSPP